MSHSRSTQDQQHLSVLSRNIGAQVPAWTQGAGGNVSVKSNVGSQSVLFIKASGQRLSDVTPTVGMVKVDLGKFASLWQSAAFAPSHNPFATPSLPDAGAELQYANLLTDAQCAAGSPLRPSMETGFHAFITAPWVVHMHSLAAVLMAHEQARSPSVGRWLTEKFGDGLVFLPALRPGLALTLKVREHAAARAIVLANHGVILGLQAPAEMREWQQLEIEFCRAYGYDKLALLLGDHAHLSTNFKPFSRPIPMRFYFPDTAVFAARIQAKLRPVAGDVSDSGEPLFVMEGGDANASEIWAAQQILYGECPELAELPELVTRSVAGLPTEQLRLARSAS